MAKYKPKEKNGIEADQFEISKPGQWPDGCQSNPLSNTGFSYGTLEVTQGGKNRDGFEIFDGDYICTDSNGTVYRMTESDFNEYFEAA